MADDLLDNYNPLYDVHLQQYFASPHMQKHLRRIGLLGDQSEYDDRNENDMYDQHNVTMDLLLKNREKQLAKLAALQKKLDAAEKVEICRKIRSGQTPGTTQPRSRPSRSLSRGPKVAARSGRRSSTSTDDKDLIKRIESEGEETPRANATVYNRLSASIGKYRYLHKLDDYTLSAYMEELRKQLRRLERFRDVSFGPHSVARHPSEPQESWFFRRRSLPSFSDSGHANSVHEHLRLPKIRCSDKNQPENRILETVLLPTHRSSSKSRSSRSTSKKRNEPVRVQKLKMPCNEAKASTSLEIVGTSAMPSKERRKPTEVIKKKKSSKTQMPETKEIAPDGKQAERKEADNNSAKLAGNNEETRKVAKHFKKAKSLEKAVEVETSSKEANDFSSNFMKMASNNLTHQHNEPYVAINDGNYCKNAAGSSADFSEVEGNNAGEKMKAYSDEAKLEHQKFIPSAVSEDGRISEQPIKNNTHSDNGSEPALLKELHPNNTCENKEQFNFQTVTVSDFQCGTTSNDETSSHPSNAVRAREIEESAEQNSTQSSHDRFNSEELVNLNNKQESATFDGLKQQSIEKLDLTETKRNDSNIESIDDRSTIEVGDKVAGTIEDEVTKYMENQLRERVEDQMIGKSEVATEKIEDQVAEVENELSERIENEVTGRLSDEITEKVENTINEEIEDKLAEKTKDQINEKMGNQTEVLKDHIIRLEGFIANSDTEGDNDNSQNVLDASSTKVLPEFQRDTTDINKKTINDELQSETSIRNNFEKTDTLNNTSFPIEEPPAKPSEWVIEKQQQQQQQQQRQHGDNGDMKSLTSKEFSNEYNLPFKDNSYLEEQTKSLNEIDEKMKGEKLIPYLVDSKKTTSTDHSFDVVVDNVINNVRQDDVINDKVTETCSPEVKLTADALSTTSDGIKALAGHEKTEFMSPKPEILSQSEMNTEQSEALADRENKLVEKEMTPYENINEFEDDIGNNEKLDSLSQEKAVIEDFKGVDGEKNSDNTSTDTEGADAVLSDYEDLERPTSTTHYNLQQNENLDLERNPNEETSIPGTGNSVYANNYFITADEEESIGRHEVFRQGGELFHDNELQTHNFETESFSEKTNTKVSDGKSSVDQLILLSDTTDELPLTINNNESAHKNDLISNEQVIAMELDNNFKAKNSDTGAIKEAKPTDNYDEPAQPLDINSIRSTYIDVKESSRNQILNRATEDSENNNFNEVAKKSSDEILQNNSSAILNVVESAYTGMECQSSTNTELLDVFANESTNKVSNVDNNSSAQEDLQNNNHGNYFNVGKSDIDTKQEHVAAALSLTTNENDTRRFLYNDGNLIASSTDSLTDEDRLDVSRTVREVIDRINGTGESKI